ncbi:helix-turn-helix domain-containing protein [Uliginosibacterium gangwonense]|uniref:helix-turn-helix domain-containing protein n=1 Tax=Uliginosibacterium gangwonense TaxID=392736 RepID=UPI00035C2C41|nr:helix-turn-helix transcriptional regulator [Uliginosibacterium gangwonense]
MSSPFSDFLRSQRLRSGLRQAELAHLLGYEQAYISALELGEKPPSEEFLKRLGAELRFTAKDFAEMNEAVLESQRRYVLPRDLPTDIYRMYRELWLKLEKLHPAQIGAIRHILKLDEQMKSEPVFQPARIKRRTQEQEATM